MAPVICERCRIFKRRLGKRCINCGFQMLRVAAIAVALLGMAVTAHAQSNPSLVFGQVPSPTNWNNYFAVKVDVASGTLTNPTISGGVINGITLNSALINSPTIATGTLTNPTITTGTLTGPTITGATISSSTISGGLTLVNPEVTGTLTTSNTMTSAGGSSALIGTIVPTATTPTYVYGLTITKLAASVGQGSTSDAALHITSDFHEENGRSWHRGIVFGTAGTASFPVDVTGKLITVEAADSNFADIGVDMSGAFFVTASYKAMGFLVDGSGNVTGNSFKANSQAGVSCAASTVTLATLVVTAGIVTHC